MHYAKILADSYYESSYDTFRLTTFEVRFPRIILSELNTHRMLARSSASSRAIPLAKMIDAVQEDPYIPTVWPKNQAGMSASEYLTGDSAVIARDMWLRARDNAVMAAEALGGPMQIHKQTVNRLLEPFMWHTAIISATDWDNFFHLRAHPAAHPEIQTLAVMMREARIMSNPKALLPEEWHLPLFFDEDRDLACPEQAPRISSARCARVSYLTHDGRRDIAEDLALADRLEKSGHMSPFEHVARPMTEDEIRMTRVCRPYWDPSERKFFHNINDETFYLGPFNGFVQYRKQLSREWDALAPVPNA